MLISEQFQFISPLKWKTVRCQGNRFYFHYSLFNYWLSQLIWAESCKDWRAWRGCNWRRRNDLLWEDKMQRVVSSLKGNLNSTSVAKWPSNRHLLMMKKSLKTLGYRAPRNELQYPGISKDHWILKRRPCLDSLLKGLEQWNEKIGEVLIDSKRQNGLNRVIVKWKVSDILMIWLKERLVSGIPVTFPRNRTWPLFSRLYAILFHHPRLWNRQPWHSCWLDASWHF